MAIDKNNYEAWFLDYAEGNLTERQVEELFAFLEDHPELKDEFEEGIEVIPLRHEDSGFAGHEDLKREQQVGFITLDNYEEYMIASAEEDLSPAEKEELDQFMANHPELEGEKAIYAGIDLVADTSIVFPDKASLKKETLITEENLDDFLIGHIEGDLNEEEEAALTAHMEAHAGVHDELDAYAHAHLNPDFSIQYPDKDELKHRIGIVIPLYVRYAAAVAAILVLVFSIINTGDDEGLIPEMANIEDVNEEEVPVYILIDDMRQHFDGNHNYRPDVPESYGYQTPTSYEEQYVEEQPQEDIQQEEEIDPVNDIQEEHIAEDDPMEEMIIPLDTIEKMIDIDTPDEDGIAQVPVNNNANTEMTIWQYAGKTVKEDVLGQENVTDGKIRENDVAGGFTRAVGAMTTADVAFVDHSDEETVSYGIRIGRFGFSRTKTKD